MSTSSNDAAAQLASFNRNNGMYGIHECNFAYVGNNVGIGKNQHKYICVGPDGKLECVQVAVVVSSNRMYGIQSHTCIGVALEHVSSDTDVQKAKKKLDQSKIVANLRQMMADGKFAPIVPTL